MAETSYIDAVAAAPELALRRWQRVLPSLVGLAAFLGMALLWVYGDHALYLHVLRLWGMAPFDYPFLDLDGNLAAWECSRQGIDVILADPCDVLQRGYNYSPLWMSIDGIPLGRQDRIPCGIALCVAFLLSLSALPPPLSWAETGLRVGGVLSTMAAFALERANPDLFVFLLVLAMTALLRGPTIARAVGYGLGFLGGAFKYYPFIVLGLMARERVRVLLAMGAAALTAFTIFVAVYFRQIAEGLPHIASGGPFGEMFGAKNFIMGMFLIIRRMLDPTAGVMVTKVDGALIRLGVIALGVTILFIALVARCAVKLWRASDVRGALRHLDEPRRLALVAGALLLSGCFIMGQSVSYRGVALFFVLPGLYAMGRDKAAGLIGRAARYAAVGIVPLMWTEGIRLWTHWVLTGEIPDPRAAKVIGQPLADGVLWFARELAWWSLVALFILIIVAFVQEAPLFNRQRPSAVVRPAS